LIENERSLYSQYPKLCKEWNYNKNDAKPEQFSVASGKKVWWICKENHEWEARISDRVRGNGCPYCAGKKTIIGVNDLVTLNPKLTSEWNYIKNDEKKPEQFMSHSGKKTWWKCRAGHEWEATIDSRSRGNGCPYCAGQKVIIGINDLATMAPEIAQSWDYVKNGTLKPTEICVSSGKKVFWRCEYGHSWNVPPNRRVTQKSGCPICSSELRTSFPEQAVFYYAKQCFAGVENRVKLENGMELDVYISKYHIGIEYDGLLYHEGYKAQERECRKNSFCKLQGIRLIHIKEVRNVPEEQQTDYIYRKIADRSKGLDAVLIHLFKSLEMYFTKEIKLEINTERDQDKIMLQYLNIDNKLKGLFDISILDEWDYEKNDELKPAMFYRGSKKKVWWKCECGHSWKTAVNHRTNEKTPTGCPYCSNQAIWKGFNDLVTVNPKLAEQWNYEKHNDLLPENIMYRSVTKVWWRCDYGHEWEASIKKRADGRNCLYCSGKKVMVGFNDLASIFPDIALEWNYEKNENLYPTSVSKGSNKIVWWKCKHGHEWKAMINRRTLRNTKCPYCRK